MLVLVLVLVLQLLVLELAQLTPEHPLLGVSHNFYKI